MARTNISVDQNIFQEFSTQAERQSKTLFAFANESLQAIAKIAAEGGGPSELYRMWRSVSLLKQIDVITLPSDFMDDLIARQYLANKEDLLRMFSDLGGKIVGILKIAASNLDELAELAKDFTALLPVKQFKILKHAEDGMVEIGIVGAGRKIESTECTVEFLTSILNGYGYRVTKKEINVGTIRLSAVPLSWAKGQR